MHPDQSQQGQTNKQGNEPIKTETNEVRAVQWSLRHFMAKFDLDRVSYEYPYFLLQKNSFLCVSILWQN